MAQRGAGIANVYSQKGEPFEPKDKEGIMNDSFSLKFVRFMIKTLHVVAFIALMVMMSIVVANVIGRIFFKSPVMGTLEVAGFAGVIVVAVAIGLAQRENRNVFVDIIISRFSERLRIIADCFTYILSLIAVGFLFWAVTESAIDALTQGEITLTLSLKTYPFRFVWAAGLLLLCCFLIHRIIGIFKGVKK
ncbi:TRAP transporter small permease [Thermodesulfobacteriota bacterium]